MGEGGRGKKPGGGKRGRKRGGGFFFSVRHPLSSGSPLDRSFPGRVGEGDLEEWTIPGTGRHLMCWCKNRPCGQGLR